MQVSGGERDAPTDVLPFPAPTANPMPAIVGVSHKCGVWSDPSPAQIGWLIDSARQCGVFGSCICQSTHSAHCNWFSPDSPGKSSA